MKRQEPAVKGLRNQEKQQQKKEQKAQGEPKQKKTLSILKKKPKTQMWNNLYKNVDLNHVVNVHDMIFLNEQALKDPENNESLFSAIFFYKSIAKVAINEDFISVSLKKLDQNVLPPEYFYERFRSFGDQKFYNIANYMERLCGNFQKIQNPQKRKELIQFKKQNFCFQQQTKMLQVEVQKMKGKKYLMFFSQISPNGVMLKKIIMSVPLLHSLGFQMNELALDFIKHKHIFFEIFTSKMYSYVMEAAMKNYTQLTDLVMQNQYKNQQIMQMTQLHYNDELIRKRKVQGGVYEEKLSAKVKWFSPHPSIGVFQIQDVLECSQPYESKKKIKKFQQPNIDDELRSLQHLTKISPNLLSQNKNRCCTFKMINPNITDKDKDDLKDDENNNL